jgi:hypothetical protein
VALRGWVGWDEGARAPGALGNRPGDGGKVGPPLLPTPQSARGGWGRGAWRTPTTAKPPKLPVPGTARPETPRNAPKRPETPRNTPRNAPRALHSHCGSCVLRSHSRTVVSPLPLASRRPSGLKFTASTASEWPGIDAVQRATGRTRKTWGRAGRGGVGGGGWGKGGRGAAALPGRPPGSEGRARAAGRRCAAQCDKKPPHAGAWGRRSGRLKRPRAGLVRAAFASGAAHRLREVGYPQRPLHRDAALDEVRAQLAGQLLCKCGCG